MKLRTGFVSNSSSSAFILIVKRENHERVWNSILSGEERDSLEGLFYVKEFFGDEVIVWEQLDIHGTSYLNGEDEYDRDAFDYYAKQVNIEKCLVESFYIDI